LKMSNDSQFLVRAAAYYNHATALDNQTEMFVYIWGALSAEEQELALEIWQEDRQSQAKGMPQSGIPSSQAQPQTPVIPQAGIDLIKEFEGYHEQLGDGRAQAYADPIHGWEVPTIGFGTTKYPDHRRVQQGDIITSAEAEEYLAWEVERLCRPVLEKIPTWAQMNSNQRSALYSFAYNLGAHFYGGPNFQSITRVCSSPDRWGDHPWIEEQFVKYRNPGSPAEVGLRRRRVAEAKLFCTPV
jgi:GH24 family phage-related lysozyme (muramidase)